MEKSPKYNKELVNMADGIECAPYLFDDNIELYGAASSCKGCGGKCYGPASSGPKFKEKSGLAKKVIELLEK